jgi:hypothetical protein
MTDKTKSEEKKVEDQKPIQNNAQVLADFFDEIPEKEPIFVAIGGEAGLGKTHFCNTFPNPVFADTEDRAQIVMKKFGNKFRKSTKDISDIRNTISIMSQYIVKEQEASKFTFVLDSASDFQQMAESEWLKEAKKDKVFPLVLWSKVFDKMDQVFNILRKLGFNAIFTQQMKEIYRNEKATGEFEMAGYKKIPYRVDVRLQLRKGIELDGELYYPDIIVAEVLKDPWNPNEKRKPYLIDVSYDGIFNELKNYKHPGIREDAIKAILKEMEKKTGIPVTKAKVNNKG